MKKVISSSISRIKSLKQWVGQKAQSWTFQQSRAESCCEKFDKKILYKLALLADENRRLKEELRLRDLDDNRMHDL